MTNLLALDLVIALAVLILSVLMIALVKRKLRAKWIRKELEREGPHMKAYRQKNKYDWQEFQKAQLYDFIGAPMDYDKQLDDMLEKQRQEGDQTKGDTDNGAKEQDNG